MEVIWDVAAGLKSFATPGHASHHASYLLDDGTLLTTTTPRASGFCRASFIIPHAPPPEVDLEAWADTFDEILRHQPERLALIHFGVVSGVEDVAEHVGRTREYLAVWAERVRGGMSDEEFVAAARADLEEKRRRRRQARTSARRRSTSRTSVSNATGARSASATPRLQRPSDAP